MELIYHPILHTVNFKNVTLSILRLDLLDTDISGNKWFKLKYNIHEAKKNDKTTILTFGGAFSNHIAATAKACKLANLKSIGLIRGDALSLDNPTLQFAQSCGMKIEFLSREAYKQKNNIEFLETLKLNYPEAFIIPEGGDNAFGEKGCSEILNDSMKACNVIFCAHGTGTTFKGIAKSLFKNQKVIAINVLKFDADTHLNNATILNQYHFGGYAKHTKELIEFKNWFESEYNITLDYVYTAKLFFAVFDLIKLGMITSKDNPLIIHSGGIQGNLGYELRYNLNPKRQLNENQG